MWSWQKRRAALFRLRFTCRRRTWALPSMLRTHLASSPLSITWPLWLLPPKSEPLPPPFSNNQNQMPYQYLLLQPRSTPSWAPQYSSRPRPLPWQLPAPRTSKPHWLHASQLARLLLELGLIGSSWSPFSSPTLTFVTICSLLRALLEPARACRRRPWVTKPLSPHSYRSIALAGPTLSLRSKQTSRCTLRQLQGTCGLLRYWGSRRARRSWC